MSSAATVTLPIAEYEQLKRDSASVRIARQDLADILTLGMHEANKAMFATATMEQPKIVRWVGLWLQYYLRCQATGKTPTTLDEWVVGHE